MRSALLALLVLLLPLGSLPADEGIQAQIVGCGFCGHPVHRPWHYRSCKYYGVGLDSSGDSAGSPEYAGSGDPAVNAMAPHLQRASSQLGEALGQALARALFGNPDEKRRQAEIAAWRQAREQERLKSKREFQRDMLDKQTEELAHLRGERHRKILERLKRLSDGAVWNSPSTGASDVVDLRPGGNSFFGLGDRASDPPFNDPMVVDLRHVRQGAYLAQAAKKASPEDAELLLDQAMRVSSGRQGFVPVYDKDTPPVSQDGLLAFQKANADYTKAHDFRATVTRHEQETLRAAELSAQSARQARQEYEAAKAAGLKGPELEAKRLKAKGLFADAQRQEEAWRKGHEETLAAQTEAAMAWNRSRRTLKAVSAGRDPQVDLFEKAPPSGVDEKTWKGFQEEMFASRKAAEAERARLLKNLPPPPLPEPEGKVRVHEGVILGTFGTEQVAGKMAAEGRSALTGKTYREMNASKFWNQPGRQGAVVAGFGTPKDATASGLQEVAGRVPGDHFSRGQVSLHTPQAKQALEQLEGKSYDRLVAHSNGSPIALALIERGSIEVNELHIVAGDRALTDATYLQSLIDRGKVKRVIVWQHVNDPILITNALPRTDEPELLAEHVVRTATGTAQGGTAHVEPMFSWGQGGIVGSHYLQESYYPDMAKAYGNAWPP